MNATLALGPFTLASPAGASFTKLTCHSNLPEPDEAVPDEDGEVKEKSITMALSRRADSGP